MPKIRMTIEEAINHCREIASDESKCEECREDHAQLAIWLMELKVIRDIEPPESESAMRKALIILDRLNTTERIDVDRAKADHAAVGDPQRQNHRQQRQRDFGQTAMLPDLRRGNPKRRTAANKLLPVLRTGNSNRKRRSVYDQKQRLSLLIEFVSNRKKGGVSHKS